MSVVVTGNVVPMHHRRDALRERALKRVGGFNRITGFLQPPGTPISGIQLGTLIRVLSSFCTLILASCFGRPRVLARVFRVSTPLLLVFFFTGLIPALFKVAGLCGFHLIAPKLWFLRGRFRRSWCCPVGHPVVAYVRAV